tara:strand:+ start:936 stop:1211 length:276 start_codon:yes stop_codon:yes gene_type:complete
MSVRHGPDAYPTAAQQLRNDITTIRGVDGELKFEDLTATEQSAATIGVHPEAWKPISWLNAGHYTELLKKNALAGRLTQQIEAFKQVAAGQ